MNGALTKVLICGAAFALLVSDAHGRGGGFTGGGGGARGGGGGHAAGARAAAGHAAAARGASRPSGGHMGGGGHAAAQRPNIQRPSVSRPAVSNPPANRPAINRPNIENRPGGGMRPTTRPNIERPNIERPSAGNRLNVNRPNVERLNVNRPNVERPNTNRPNITRPEVNRPGTTRPEITRPGNRPNIERPITRPSIPDLGGGANQRPGITRPDRPGTTRPNLPGGGTRPSPGDIGDFLGMDRPVRPGTLPENIRPGDRPGITRPDRPGIDRPGIDRPGIDRPGITRPDRPGDRPGIDRPGDRPNRPRPENRPPLTRPERPSINNRPINIGNINLGNNTIINNRPSWVNINNNQINAIGNRWQNQIGGLHTWGTRHPNRIGFWNGWGNGVRNRWGFWHNPRGWFGPVWWRNHPHRWSGWHYGWWFNRFPWNHWWRFPTFGAVTNWFVWTAPRNVWAEPVFYDYGQGGNVVYQDNSVYIDGQQVATSDEFAQSAMDLATVAPPTDEAAAEAAEWMPLGTFAISTAEKDVDPTRVIQLAVDRQGVISGTLYNTETNEAKTVQGQVDKNTQRVAFRIGDSEEVVVETGLYNLTQDEAPALVHFGKDRTENWLLVRMEEPDEEPAPETPPQQ